MADLECKMEKIIAQKIENALSSKKDIWRQMILEKYPFAQDRLIRQRREEVKAFTFLNTSRAKILMKIWNIKELDWPKPMAAFASKRDKSRYCHFHRELHKRMHPIEGGGGWDHLLKWGLLTKNVKNDQGKSKVDNRPLASAGVINVITGGIATGGDSNSAIKY